ncbi:hypothetical protein ACH5RR_023364 [Cinchona calisaya]|uniref:RNase H type-1 domain-containing protein n=1 Tax=Cinchona calisaya TaxID=153742 RepID=A0ABD2ZAG3_9GENT
MQPQITIREMYTNEAGWDLTTLNLDLGMANRKPMHGMRKNVVGSHKSNSGLAGIGGINHNKFGRVVFGFYKIVDSQNNFMAEAMALLEGLRICAARNWRLEAIETDSIQLQ